jgi:hypothetical protein
MMNTRILLSHFKWDKEKLMERYVSWHIWYMLNICLLCTACMYGIIYSSAFRYNAALKKLIVFDIYNTVLCATFWALNDFHVNLKVLK